MHHSTMTKLFSTALVGTFTLTTVGAASKMELGKNLKIQHEALLRSARPYKKGAATDAAFRRRLDQNDFEIDGSYNIKFEQCVDIKLLDEDLFDEDVIEYTQAGNITSTQSYAIFHVCQESDCYYESEDDLYIVDLPTYVMNVASYYANAKSSYCGACATYYNDFCVAQDEDDAAAANDDAADANDDAAANVDDAAANADDAADYYAADDAADYDDAARKLQNQRRTQNYIECDVCEAYGCVSNNNDDDQQGNDDDNTALELIEDIAQCLNTGLNWNNDDLYVGFICSPYDGDGVELAIFLDDECTVYTNLKAFSDIPSWYIYNDEDRFTEAETYIKNAFTETTPCLYEEFGDPAYQKNNGDDDAAVDDAAAAGDEGYAVNDFCDGFFDEGPIAFNSCLQNDDQNNNNQNNGNNDDQYNWYTYDMDYNNAQDLDGVCAALQQMEGNYEYQYDQESSGTWNDHSGWWGGSSADKSNKGRWSFLGGDGENKEGFATSGIMIFFYVLLGFTLAIGVLFMIGVREKRKRERIEPVYQGGKLV